MRAVIDTNIFIRALIKPSGSVGPVLDRLAAGDFTAIYSEPLLEELLATLALPRIRKKYRLSDVDIADLLALLALRELVEPGRNVKVCRDPDDDMFIEAALEGKAAWVVTGDEDLLSLKKFESIRFVTPRRFLDSF
ncbi:MAG TPA: putative toxin-antitoxin system toxin component, PIN family [Vicinamibacteria bacterium]|jgi:putative PIN family toxin of toxin-antitoxin system